MKDRPHEEPKTRRRQHDTKGKQKKKKRDFRLSATCCCYYCHSVRTWNRRHSQRITPKNKRMRERDITLDDSVTCRCGCSKLARTWNKREAQTTSHWNEWMNGRKGKEGRKEGIRRNSFLQVTCCWNYHVFRTWETTGLAQRITPKEKTRQLILKKKGGRDETSTAYDVLWKRDVTHNT